MSMLLGQQKADQYVITDEEGARERNNHSYALLSFSFLKFNTEELQMDHVVR